MNELACQAIPGTLPQFPTINAVGLEDVDTGTGDQWPMHVCNDTRFEAMSGVNLSGNQLLCTIEGTAL